MTVRLYRSTDASAPTLTGQAGSLTTLLDAVLVNGYGSSTAAGWTIAHTGTNQRVYRNSAALGTGMYLYVNDAAPTTAREARMTGFEAATGLGTGTGQFPSSNQFISGSYVVCRKSATADATARVWTILADETVFYLFAYTGDSTASQPFYFGDVYSYKTGDAYRCHIAGRYVENTASTGSTAEYQTQAQGATTFETSGSAGQYLARSFTGVGGSVPITNYGVVGTSSSSSQSVGSYVSGIYTYPNATDGALLLSPQYVVHNRTFRGYRKGLWVPLQSRPGANGDTFSGSSAGGLNGKTFLLVDVGSSSTGQLALETSDTW